jgi:hypothetical protein
VEGRGQVGVKGSGLSGVGWGWVRQGASGRGSKGRVVGGG